MGKDNNNHTINVNLFDGIVETVEFRCGDKLLVTRVGDGNIQMDCPECRRDFVTVGAGANKVILA